ncbi:unnamed protein product [Moneuplotes crassus]|uniref:Uncharacterized protein n=1 Tax=Euplotes crassus TaxID=5936 RepID=A0AAD1Y025_EUPCR|nr:unnamed protein product [Moneuplotes crassus]
MRAGAPEVSSLTTSRSWITLIPPLRSFKILIYLLIFSSFTDLKIFTTILLSFSASIPS